MSNLQINTRVRRLFHYLEDFERGIIRIPAFQRDFEWKLDKKVKLFDSIKNGYPIGSILFWRPDFSNLDDFRNFESEKIGSYYLKERSIDYFYILDGYQRLSTLFGCLVNPNKTNLKRDNIEWRIEFDLVFNLETDKIGLSTKKNKEVHEVELYKFVDGIEFYNFQTELFKLNLDERTVDIYLERYKDFSLKLSSYDIPSIDMIGGSTEEAVDIFTRLNSEGAKITSDWKVSALSFNKFKNFRLGTEIDNLINDLKIYNFHKISRKLIFQCITNSFGIVYFDKSSQEDNRKIERLAKDENFVEISRKSLDAILKAVQFLYNELYVYNSNLLPYNSQLIFITDFFNKIENPSLKQLESLKKWFWITSYSNYFTIYNLSKQRLAYNQFQEFIKNEDLDPIFYDDSINGFRTEKFPLKINKGSVRSKAYALFIVNHFKGITSKNYLKLKNNDNEGVIFSESVLFKINSLDNLSENYFPLFIDKQAFNNKIKIKRQDNKAFFKVIGHKYIDVRRILESENTEDNLLYFVSEDMKEIYSKDKNSVDKILELRKSLILKSEKIFVNELEIEYYE
nr:DUF262 domain-containing protein [uncultured Flavobacterium sp.]